MTVEPRLIDIVVALEKQGRLDDAEYYGATYPLLLSLIYDIPLEDVLSMTVETISKLEVPPEKPLKYEGWNFWHGGAAFANSH